MPTKKDSYKNLIKKGRNEKVRLIKMLLRRRFDRDAAIDYIMQFVDDGGHIDDMLREMLIWDELSRK